MDEAANRSENGAATGEKKRVFEDRPPIQFVRVSMSRSGKYFLIDTVSRACVHVNYMEAIGKSKMAAMGQEERGRASKEAPEAEAYTASGKDKGARKENDRTT